MVEKIGIRLLSRRLLAIIPSVGKAQTACVTMTAVATPGPVAIRAEGRNEQVADLTITCTGTTAPVTGTLYVAPGLPITSQPLGQATEATAVVGGMRFPGTALGALITFSDIQIPAGTSTITITNVRVDATAASQNSVTDLAIIEYQSVAGIVNVGTSAVTVATILPGLAPETGGMVTFSTCAGLSPSSGPAFLIPFGENFPTAFKTQGPIPSALGEEFTLNTETGFYLSAPGGANNEASSGTRIRITLSGVPPGVTVYVPVALSVSNGPPVNSTITLTASEAGPFSAVPPAVGVFGPGGFPIAALNISSGSGEAVYEVTAQNPATLDAFAIPVYLSGTSTALAGTSINALVELAPVGAAGNVPNFAPVVTPFTTTATAISSCLSLSIIPTTLSAAEQGVPYLQPLAALNVQNWSISSGSLPAGLSMNGSTGLISGTPTVSGSFPFTITMTGANSSAQQSFTLQVNPPLSIATTTLPTALEATPYSQTITTTGGLGAFSWFVISGSLPPGIALDPTTGILRGSTVSSGLFNFTVKVSDAGGAAATASLSLQVNVPPEICTDYGSNPPGAVNPTLRAEGTAELLGAAMFSCQGTGGTGSFQVTLRYGSPNLPIRSKVLNSATNLTEAALLPPSGPPILGTLDSTGTIITFSNVVIPSGPVNFTIVNIRADVTAATNPQVVEYITSTGVASAISPVYAGFVLPALGQATISGNTNLSTCGPITASNGPAFTVKVSNLVGGAFKLQGDSSNNVLDNLGITETGYYVTSGGVNNQANSATRIRIIFKNVPLNISVYVPTTLSATVQGNTAILTLTTSELGPFSPVSAAMPSAGNTLPQSPALAQVQILAGTGEAIYEVTAPPPDGAQQYLVPVYLVASGTVTATANPLTATVSFAPVGAVANIPNFTATGTPATAGTFSLCLLTTALQTAQVGKPYNASLTASGGTPSYRYTNAILPPGLTMSTSGAITGTPTQAGGNFTSSVTVTDAANITTQFALQIEVQYATPLAITTTSLPAGYQGVPYSQPVQVSGGTSPYIWTVSSGSLSGTGLNLDSATGLISGSPAAIGSISITVRVTDQLSVVATQPWTIQVGQSQPVISGSPTLTAGWINQPYPATTLTAVGGAQPYTWSISAGALPAGITLDPIAGTLSGTPTAPGVANFTVQAVDSTPPAGKTATQSFTLVVAQQYVISTIAGGAPPPSPVQATDASFTYAQAITTDPAGNVYFVALNSVFKVDKNGVQTRVAGNGRAGYSGDGGAATNAQLNDPSGIAIDGAGNIYVADALNKRIRRISAAGIITTVAGSGSYGCTALEGSAPAVGLGAPYGLAFDAAGNLYIADGGCGAIRKVSPSNVISSLATSLSPVGIAIDRSGNVYFAETQNQRVRKLSPSGVISTVAGNGTAGFSGDGGPATSAELNFPYAVAVDSSGVLYIADTINQRIRKVALDGTMSTLASGEFAPASIAVDGLNNVYVTTISQVLKCSPQGVISILAGTGGSGYSGDGGPATSAQLGTSFQIAVDSVGSLYVSDTLNSRIRKISSTGIIATIAGTGAVGGSGDGGQASSAQLGSPAGIALDTVGNLFIADQGNNDVRKVNPQGVITTVAGNVLTGPLGREFPGAAVDTAGNFYFSEPANVEKITTNGSLTTYAGTGTWGYSGDGGAAIDAQLFSAGGLAFDNNGVLYIADIQNARVRSVSPGGVITTFAGIGNGGGPLQDGIPAVDAYIAPGAVATDSAGDVYIADGASNRIRRVNQFGLISTVAGRGGAGYIGDGGPAINGTLQSLTGLTIDSAGNLYVADTYYDQAVRRLQPSAAQPLIVTGASLPVGALNTPYTATAISLTGGTPPYSWSVVGLPPGLSLDSATGTFAGTPTAQGTYDFTATVTDSGTLATTGTPAQIVSQNYRIVITGPPAITTISLPSGMMNTAYPTTPIIAAGGTPGYMWLLKTGSLPAGMSFDASTGFLSGAPTASGTFPITVQITDSGMPELTATQSFTLTIAAPLPPPGGGGGGGAPPPSSGPKITVAPTSLGFNAATGSLTGSQPVTLTSTADVAYPFTTNISTNSGANWLSVTPASGSLTSQTSTFSINYDATGLSQGTYTGSVTFTSAQSTAVVQVTLSVISHITVSPQSLTFTWTMGDPSPSPQKISIFSNPAGSTFNSSITAGQGWLGSPSVVGIQAPGTIPIVIITSGLNAGTLNGQVTVTSPAGDSINVPVTLTVLPATPPKLSASPLTSSLALTQNSAAAGGQITVSNSGGGTLNFTAQSSTSQGSWLTLNGGGSGSATFGAPAVLAYTINPASLTPGIYTGTITIQNTASAGETATATITLAVSKGSQSILLTQAGITVNAVAGGVAPANQSFAVLNTGSGTMNWTAAVGTMAPDNNWVSVSPASGNSVGGAAGSAVTLSFNPTGLNAGPHYGTITVTAPNAVNNPQSLSVLLNVADKATGASIGLSSGAAILSGAAGSKTKANQQITLSNPSATSVNFTTSVSTANGQSWLSMNPAGGALAPGNTSMTLQADLSSLSAGVQTGSVDLAFDDGTVDQITVVVIATGGTASATGSARPKVISACAGGKPGYLVAAVAEPLNKEALQVGVAQLVRVLLADDCGNPVTLGGTVQVMFSNGDEPLSLLDAGSGIWEGSWSSVNAASNIALSVVAEGPGALQPGTASIVVSVAAPSATAAAQPTGIANAASAAQATAQVVTPGAYVAVYGNRLAESDAPAATTIPLPTTLNGTQLLLGGIPLPLSYASANQVNGLIPQNLNVDASYPLVVMRGSTLSVPVPLTVAPYQPGIYTADSSGSGQGIVEIAGTTLLAGPTGNGMRPVQSGSEYLSVFATGLGPVLGPNGEPAPADGAAAPVSTLYRTTATVTATIGGINAPVVFSGLTPTLVGLYQVNVQVPAGVPAGGAVPLVLTITDPVNGATWHSNTVFIAVQ